MIVEAALSLGFFGLLFGAGLSLASKKFYVWVDPKEIEVGEALPGVNCGACGLPGCASFAHAVVAGTAEVNGCIAGGEAVVHSLAAIMGVEAVAKDKKIARPMCNGGLVNAKDRFIYDGVEHCKAAVLVSNGFKSCTFGCFGLGSCKISCPFNAIEINENHIPVVNPDRCTGCNKCVEVCPRHIMELISLDNDKVFVLCRSQDKGKAVKANCTVGCIGCKICDKNCPYDAIIFENSIARINYEKCRDCGVCAAKCPTKSIIDTMPVRAKAYIVQEKCTGCGECAKVCAFKAPVGVEGKLHNITEDKCIGCGVCIEKCPEKAIIRKT